MTYALSTRSKQRIKGIDSRMIEIADLAIILTAIDFGIPKDGGTRTAERQRELFDQGLSKCDGIDRPSYHQKGMALDFFAYVDNKASWNETHLAMVATAFLQSASFLGYKLQWGGLWQRFRDMPHVQLLDD